MAAFADESNAFFMFLFAAIFALVTERKATLALACWTSADSLGDGS